MSKGMLVLSVLVTLSGILGVRALIWWGVRKVADFSALPRVRRYGRTAATSARRLLRKVHPRLPARLQVRLRPWSFTWFVLTLLVLAAIYIIALLAGLTHEVLGTEEAVWFDEAVNAAFGPWRQQPLIAAFFWITALGSGPALSPSSRIRSRKIRHYYECRLINI